MRQVIDLLYREIMHESQVVIEPNRCIICLDLYNEDTLGSSSLIDHFQREHNSLGTKVFQVDLGQESFNMDIFNHMFGIKEPGMCRICGDYKKTMGIVEHYSKYHPHIVRFLNRL